MESSTAYMIGMIVGSILSGAIIGTIPLSLGITKGKTKLGIAGFCCCIVGSFIFGLILSVPFCILFVALILKKPKNSSDQKDFF
ncbi:MAG: hypothetical protein HFE62_01275 [Firmicutes bacterium]|nr:hypothetical protein [Bacillota bacterium]